ncbi:hypothetical protein BDW42DRAFT_115405 [Aspergillus taichungensis]|uniref:Uncharacterized protein n=1 Tax=Aspergillus taichungensis TaxID=482145 RepID=A0A2J5HS79_9EURO|nr:hypothetical protein BDW42DRAFT_115405 [Aspergillus taichungensis]
MFGQKYSMNFLFINMIVPIVHVSNRRTDIVPELSQGIDRLLPSLGLGVTIALGLFLLRLFLGHLGHNWISGRREVNVKTVVVKDKRDVEVSDELDFLSGNTRICGSAGDHVGSVESFTIYYVVGHTLQYSDT